jgi:hypothetical protein
MMTSPTFIAWYIPRRRYFEIGFWIAFLYGNAVANVITTMIDLRDAHPIINSWALIIRELSSNTVLLALLPLLLAIDRRWPLRWNCWRQNLPKHLICSVGFSVIHVVGMVAIRKLAFAVRGFHYDFGQWPMELLYEYLKDVRTYFYILAFVYLYRLLILRLQGEATLLAAPDVGAPLDPIDRPERFLVRKLGKEFLVSAHDIEWLEASGNYVNLHVLGQIYPLRSTMAAIEERLAPSSFRRVHRSYIVNLDQLVHIEPLESGDAQLLLRNGKRVPCSRRYRSNLRVSD